MPLQHENFFKSHIFVPHKKRISTESGLWIIWTLTKSNQIHPWPLCWRCYGSLIWGLLLNHLLCPSCYHHPEHNIQGVSHLMVTTRPILTILEQFAQDLTRPPPWFTLSLWHLNCPSGRTALFCLPLYFSLYSNCISTFLLDNICSQNCPWTDWIWRLLPPRQPNSLGQFLSHNHRISARFPGFPQEFASD